MEYKTPEEIAANTASILSWRRHLEKKALKSKMRAARCPSTHCERRQECTSLAMGVPSLQSPPRSEPITVDILERLDFQNNMDWELALPIIEAHIAKQRALIAALSVKARSELD